MKFLGFIVIYHLCLPLFALAETPRTIEITYTHDGKTRPLMSWNEKSLLSAKQSKSKEKEPHLGAMIEWSGALLSDVIQKSIETLSVSERAQIDVLIFHDAQNSAILMPRALIQRFPVLLMSAEEKNIHKRGKHYTIMPWTSKPKLMQEQLPISKYFVWNLKSIELTSFREKFPGVFLKRQNDPTASRGEKVFVQNCLSCHGSRGAVTPEQLLPAGKAKALGTGAHPKTEGLPHFDERTIRALESYSRVLREEHTNTSAMK